MNPLITIAIPVYNVEKYVEQALLSALNQTYTNIEILVIDDKGKDNSMCIVHNIINTHPRGKIVRIIDHKINQGTGATKNSAIDNARGEYIFFMDSDDYITNKCIEKLYQSAAANKSDMVIGSFNEITVSGKLEKEFIQKMESINSEDALWQWFKSPMFYVQTWNKLYRLNILKKNFVRCIPSNKNEDVFFTFQIIKSIVSVSFVTEVTYIYRILNPKAATYNSRMGIFNEVEFFQFLGILNEMLDYMNNKNFINDKFSLEYFIWFYQLTSALVSGNKYLLLYQRKKYITKVRELPLDKINFPSWYEGLKKYGISWIYLCLPPGLLSLMISFRLKCGKVKLLWK